MAQMMAQQPMINKRIQEQLADWNPMMHSGYGFPFQASAPSQPRSWLPMPVLPTGPLGLLSAQGQGVTYPQQQIHRKESSSPSGSSQMPTQQSLKKRQSRWDDYQKGQGFQMEEEEDDGTTGQSKKKKRRSRKRDDRESSSHESHDQSSGTDDESEGNNDRTPPPPSKDKSRSGSRKGSKGASQHSRQ